jgi:hypothetical protein
MAGMRGTDTQRRSEGVQLPGYRRVWKKLNAAERIMVIVLCCQRHSLQ